MIKIDWDKSTIQIGEVIIKTEDLIKKGANGEMIVTSLEKELRKLNIETEVTPF